jgi:hypothetical protein
LKLLSISPSPITTIYLGHCSMLDCTVLTAIGAHKNKKVHH